MFGERDRQTGREREKESLERRRESKFGVLMEKPTDLPPQT